MLANAELYEMNESDMTQLYIEFMARLNHSPSSIKEKITSLNVNSKSGNNPSNNIPTASNLGATEVNSEIKDATDKLTQAALYLGNDQIEHPHSTYNDIEIDYIKTATQKANIYLDKNSHEKAKQNTDTLQRLEAYDKSAQQAVDYVSLFNLKIVIDRGKKVLDLRGGKSNLNKLRELLGQKRTRLAADSMEDAVIEVNQLIANKVIESGQQLAPSASNEHKTMAMVLKSSLIANKGKKSALEMASKIAFWQFTIGSTPVNQVTSELVAEIQELMFNAGLNKSTISGYNTELSKALKIAIRKGYITVMPKIDSFQSDRRKFIELPIKSWSRLIQAYAKTEQERCFLELTYLNGLRYSTNRGLKFDDFKEQENGQWFLHLPADRNKSGEAIDIAVSDKAREIILHLKKQQKKEGIKSPYVFKQANGKLTEKDDERWKKALETCELPSETVFHHLRHYFATRLRRKGVELEVIRSLGGWKCLESLKRYIHCGVTQSDYDAINHLI
ncbi:tyrosine-type recombinase/integrase [uncultured Shewanella sp.]|uniref:tyrosine-type recombinase/integrase n=1 Tax=uncultured Shewanella sp. TaxID=173975 RepID=UPI002605D088|nr:tyrosine-type recombinase/integrase [uncultured Shewanella sp.]